MPNSLNGWRAEQPEWLAIKPFALSWMCGIEPSNLASELPSLRIGIDSVNWYQQEIDRYHELSNKFMAETAQHEPDNTGDSEQNGNAEYTKLLVEFSEPFLQIENTD